MNSKKQLIFGTIVGYMTVAVQILSTLIITPFLLSQIGENEYGIYKIVTSLIAYLSVCNFGFGNTLVRFLSKFRAENRLDEGNKLLSFVTLLNAGATLVAVILGIIVFFNIPAFFSQSLTGNDLTLTREVFLILLCSVAASILNDLYLSCVYVYEKFIFSKTLELLKYIFRTVLLFAIVRNWRSAICVAIIDLSLSLFVLSANYFYCRFHLKLDFRIKISRNVFTAPWVKPVFQYALLLFFNLFIDQLIWNTDSIIIGMRLTTLDVTIFGAGEVISAAFSSMTQMMNNLLFPRIVRGATLNNNGEFVSSTMTQVGRIQAFIGLYILGGYAILGKSFICNVWLGPGYDNAWRSSLIVMCGTLLSALIASGHLILRAINKQFSFLMFYFLIFFLNAGLTYFTVVRYGILAAAITTSGSYALIVFCFVLPYLKKTLGLQLRRFFCGISPIILSTAGLCFVMSFVVSRLDLSSLPQILIGAVIYSFLYMIMVVAFLLNQNERDQLNELMQGVYGYIRRR